MTKVRTRRTYSISSTLKFIKERNLPDAWTLIEYDMAMNQVATMEVMDSSVFLEALHVSISIDIS